MATLGTFTAGQVLTAAELNAIGTWTTYTPTWTATTTNPAIGNGTILGQYVQINDLVIAQVKMNTGSTTTYGAGIYKISLPVTAATVLNAYTAMGIGLAFDGSTATGHTIVVLHDNLSTTDVILNTPGRVGTPDANPNNPFTWTNGDTLSLVFSYKAA